MWLWFIIPAALALLTVGALVRVRRQQRVVVGERGIRPPDPGWGWIPWSEIEGAYTPSAGQAETLRVRLRVTERLAGILRKRGEIDAETPPQRCVEIRLDLAGSELSAVQLLQEILARQGARPETP